MKQQEPPEQKRPLKTLSKLFVLCRFLYKILGNLSEIPETCLAIFTTRKSPGTLENSPSNQRKRELVATSRDPCLMTSGCQSPHCAGAGSTPEQWSLLKMAE